MVVYVYVSPSSVPVDGLRRRDIQKYYLLKIYCNKYIKYVYFQVGKNLLIYERNIFSGHRSEVNSSDPRRCRTSIQSCKEGFSMSMEKNSPNASRITYVLA